MEVVSNMARPKKDNVPVSLRIEKELFDRLNQFCEDSGQPKTVAMERALTMQLWFVPMSILILRRSWRKSSEILNKLKRELKCLFVR